MWVGSGAATTTTGSVPTARLVVPVTVIAASPGITGCTTPAASTLATAGSELTKVYAASVPLTVEATMVRVEPITTECGPVVTMVGGLSFSSWAQPVPPLAVRATTAALTRTAGATPRSQARGAIHAGAIWTRARGGPGGDSGGDAQVEREVDAGGREGTRVRFMVGLLLESTAGCS